MPSLIDAAANVIDVGSGPVDGSCQLLLFGVVHLDDVTVNQHLPGISAEIPGAELLHLVGDELQLRFVQTDFFSDGSCAVRH